MPPKQGTSLRGIGAVGPSQRQLVSEARRSAIDGATARERRRVNSFEPRQPPSSEHIGGRCAETRTETRGSSLST
jgi:hypothetical protein